MTTKKRPDFKNEAPVMDDDAKTFWEAAMIDECRMYESPTLIEGEYKQLNQVAKAMGIMSYQDYMKAKKLDPDAEEAIAHAAIDVVRAFGNASIPTVVALRKALSDAGYMWED